MVEVILSGLEGKLVPGARQVEMKIETEMIPARDVTWGIR